MPKFDKNISLPKNILLWKVEESWLELLNYFDKNSEINTLVHNINNDSKKRQFLASRILLLQEFGTWETTANNNGKPSITNYNCDISITHDKGLVGVVFDSNPCGIDLQEISKKVLRIKAKFVNENDLYSNSVNEQELMLLWCAKEALYKINGNPKIFFKEHMIIEPTSEKNVITGKIIHPDYCEDYKMKVHFIENYCLVYTL